MKGKQYCSHGNYVEKRETNPKECTGRGKVVLEAGQIRLYLTLTVHFDVAASSPVGAVNSSLSLLLEFFHDSLLCCQFLGTGGVKGCVSAFAVDAEQWGDVAAPCDGPEMAAPGALFVLSEASVGLVCVVFGA